ncbi:lccl domain protein [Anaeramoeba flamelloides]|uniref:Lccl domain protein n=1 Tax=Anaeramoeba flamelloides TaxID=1746091 RepID=A0ABQ8Z456_9EUKA|nr:lccl domain protein [Anaeramoeba flamelloides]
MQIPTNIITLPTSIPVQVQQNLTLCFNCPQNQVKQPALYFCFDCQSYYCQDCNSSVHKNFSGHNSKLISEIEKNPNLCLEHQKKYEKYCYEHCSMMCPDCFESKCQNHKSKTVSINDVFEKIISPMKISVNSNSVEQSIEYLELKKQNLERQKQINVSALSEMIFGLQKTGEQIKQQVDHKIAQLIKFSKEQSFNDTKRVNSILTNTTRELSLLKNNVNLVQHFQELILQNEIIEATKIGLALNPKFQMNQSQSKSNQFVNSKPQYKLTFDREVVNMINKMDLKQINEETEEIKKEEGLERIPQTKTPKNLWRYKERINEIFEIYITGANSGSAWGSDVYTYDSTLSKSVVHAGLLGIGESGWVKVKILPGKQSYSGTTRNGVSTLNYGNYGGSYQFIKEESIEQIPQNQTPRNLSVYQRRINQIFEIYITGANSGSVWGSDIYTYDSSLSKSAVHAGLLGIGESGWVKVKILPGEKSYSGTTRNGVSTLNYGNFGGSYKFVDQNICATNLTNNSETKKPKYERIPQNQTPRNLSGYKGRINEIFEIYLTGANSGSVWGSDVYTYDSTLFKSVVHAGLLGIGESGWVKVKILPGKQSYLGTTRNGVTTTNYGNYGGSYQFIKEESIEQIPQNQTPRNLSGYKGRINEIFEIYLTGTNSGSVWGSDIYTYDSTLSKSVVHAGLLGIGESGWVKVKILPGMQSYLGTTRNGVSTTNYGKYGGSYKFI